MPQRCKGPSELTALCISVPGESPSSASAWVPERGRPPDAGQASLWGSDWRLALGSLHHFLQVRLERGESRQAAQGFLGQIAQPRVDSPPPLNYHGKLARPGPARRNPLNPARTER